MTLDRLEAHWQQAVEHLAGKHHAGLAHEGNACILTGVLVSAEGEPDYPTGEPGDVQAVSGPWRRGTGCLVHRPARCLQAHQPSRHFLHVGATRTIVARGGTLVLRALAWNTQPARRFLRFSALLLALVLLVWLRFAMTAGGFRNSDDASNLLAGVELAEGNWQLHGWIMATDNYYPTDVLAQAVLYALFGFHPILMQGAEAAIWAAIAFVGIRLALLDAAYRHWPGIVAIALSLLAFNQFDHAFRDSFLTTLPSHGFTILLMVLAFTLFVGGGRRRTGIRLAGLGVVTAMGSFSDPIFNVVACLPMLGVGVLGIRGGGNWRRSLLPVCAVVVAILAARWLLTLNARSGGFQSIGLSVTLATIPQLLQNLSFAVEAIARLLGAEFTGRTIDQQASGGVMVHLLRIPFLIGFAAATVMLGGAMLREVRDWPGGTEQTRGDELDRLLWLSLVLCIASTVMTTVIVDPTCARFFLPAMVAGSILMARQLGRVPLLAAYGLIMLPISIMAALLSIPRVAPGQGIAVPQETKLVETLLARGLRHGYAGFWEANMTTVLSKRAVISLPILGGDDHRLHPLIWFDNLDWFRQAARDWDGRIFFVVSQQPAGLELSRDMVVRQFGPPKETIDLDLYSVLTYNLGRNDVRTLVP